MDENKYMSRKFGLTAFIVLISIPLLAFNLIPAAAYVNLNTIALGLYFTGNVAQKFLAESSPK